MTQLWRGLCWLGRHWYIPVVVVLGVAVWILSRGRTSPTAPVEVELEAIEAGAEVRRVNAKLGAEQARQHVQDKYREQLAALDEKQRARAEELSNDPAKLAKFLVRAGKRGS